MFFFSGNENLVKEKVEEEGWNFRSEVRNRQIKRI